VFSRVRLEPLHTALRTLTSRALPFSFLALSIYGVGAFWIPPALKALPLL
jgi:hypothetical protein